MPLWDGGWNVLTFFGLRNPTSKSLIEQNRDYDKDREKSLAIKYQPSLHETLNRTLKDTGIKMINKPSTKLFALLGITKDKVPENFQSGIYKVQCNMAYIGQTCKSIEERFKHV